MISNTNMQHSPSQSLNKTRPYYKKPGFWISAAASIIAALFLLFLTSVLALRWTDPSFTSFTLREDWEQLDAERYNLRDYWVSYSDIPESMKWAVVASEDQLFWEHRGFDVESIREAWEQRQTGERIRGASTISQQVAKNLSLSQRQSFLRKGVEAVITVFIELFWPKERIIEVYLNIAEFGPGIFGIGKASDHFFGTQASSLTPEEASKMAAVLPSPKRMRVNPPSPFAAERSRWILRQMTQLSGIAYYRPEPGEPEPDEIDPLLLFADEMMESLINGVSPVTADTAAHDNFFDDPDLNLPDSLWIDQPTDTVKIRTID
jgi:monofunctional glycosyltransferase